MWSYWRRQRESVSCLCLPGQQQGTDAGGTQQPHCQCAVPPQLVAVTAGSLPATGSSQAPGSHAVLILQALSTTSSSNQESIALGLQ